MGGMILLVAAALAAPSSVTIKPAGEVRVAARAIRVVDVADLTKLDARLRSAIGSNVIASLPGERSEIAVSRASLAALVRRRVPGLNVPGTVGGSLSIRSMAPARRADLRSSCFKAIVPVATRAMLTRDMVAPAACGARSVSSVGYDRTSGTTIARAALPAGAFLGRLAIAAKPLVAKGEGLTLISTEGPVRVRRVVTALQSGRGRRLFVRDAEGQVFSAALAADMGARR